MTGVKEEVEVEVGVACRLLGGDEDLRECFEQRAVRLLAERVHRLAHL